MKSGSSALSLLRLAVAGRLGAFLVVPDVAAGDPADLPAGAAHHDAGLDRRAALQRFVGVGLQRHLLAAAQAFVGRDHAVGVAILDAAHQALRREAAEHHGMDGADAGAGQHGIGRLGDHRHVDGDAVALLDATGLQHIGEAADILMHLGVGDVLLLVRAVAFPDDRGLVAAGGEMAVDAIDADVERAVIEPADMHLAGKIDVLDLAVGLHPVDALALLAPETFGVGDRLLIQALILGSVDPGGLRRVGGNRKQAGVAHGRGPPFRRRS